MLRSFPVLALLALTACSPAASVAPEKQFVLVDPGKYKTEPEKERALQLAQYDCKVKAMATSAALEKSITSERNSMENVNRAREKGAEMYTTSFTLCMLNSGYTQK